VSELRIVMCTREVKIHKASNLCSLVGLSGDGGDSGDLIISHSDIAFYPRSYSQPCLETEGSRIRLVYCLCSETFSDDATLHRTFSLIWKKVPRSSESHLEDIRILPGDKTQLEPSVPCPIEGHHIHSLIMTLSDD